MKRVLTVLFSFLVGALLGWLPHTNHATPSVALRTSRPVSVPSLPSRLPSVREPVAQRLLSTRDPHYDPVQLLREEETLHPRDVFDSEPRDPTFAPVLEKRISEIYTLVGRELGIEHYLATAHTECHTLSCFTSIAVPKAEADHLYDALNGILLGDVQSPTILPDVDPALRDVVIYNAYTPAARDDDYFEFFLSDAVKPGLEFTKQRLGVQKP